MENRAMEARKRKSANSLAGHMKFAASCSITLTLTVSLTLTLDITNTLCIQGRQSIRVH